MFAIAEFEPFIETSRDLYTRILAGIMPLKSIKMATKLIDNVLGINIPDAIMEALRDAEDVDMTSFEIAARPRR